MIQMRTRLNVADNSGAKSVACITVKGAGGNQRYGRVGDIITGAVKESEPEADGKIPACSCTASQNRFYSADIDRMPSVVVNQSLTRPITSSCCSGLPGR